MMCEVMIQMGKLIATGACFYSTAALAKVWSDRNRAALRDCDCAGSKVVSAEWLSSDWGTATWIRPAE